MSLPDIEIQSITNVLHLSVTKIRLLFYFARYKLQRYFNLAASYRIQTHTHTLAQGCIHGSK